MKNRKFTTALLAYCLGVIISVSQLTTGYLSHKNSKPNQNFTNDYNISNLSVRSVHYPSGDGSAVYRTFSDNRQNTQVEKANTTQ